MFNWLLVEPADPERAARSRDMSRPRDYRFEWETANSDVARNDVQVPGGTGTLIDYRFDQVANPQVTSSISFDFIRNERHNIRTRFTPFEVRDTGTLTQDTLSGDQILPSGSLVFSVYFLGDLRVRYAYELLPESRVSLLAGGGLTYINTDLTLFPATSSGSGINVDVDAGERVRTRGVLPLLYLRAGVDLTSTLELYLEGDGYDFSDDTFYDITVKLRWRISPRWDIAGGWRDVASDLDIEDVRNRFKRNGFVLDVGYSF
jgi:hypothetical protein